MTYLDVIARRLPLEGRTGPYALLIVLCQCGQHHAHRVALDFTEGKRVAPCRAKYIVRVHEPALSVIA